MVIFDIFFAPLIYLYQRNVRFGQTWTFSESLFAATGDATKIEVIYSFFVFSQGSKNGQKFQKKLFFQKLNFHIPFESSWRADSKNAKIFDKISLLASVISYERVQKW